MKDKNKIIVNPYQSPCGMLLLGSIGDKLCLCDWRTEKHSARVDNRLKRMWNAEFEEGTSAVIESARQQLDEYFCRKAADIRYTTPVHRYGFSEDSVE